MAATGTGAVATRGPFTICTDPARFDLGMIHGFLTRSYWAQGIDEATVRRSIEYSLCFGLFSAERQVGFARVVTDRATFAYLADVFVIDQFRGQGLAKWMIEVILAHPDLQRLRRWLLATRDAHDLYRQYGFTALPAPGRFMERYDGAVYQQQQQSAPGAGADSGPMGDPQ
jgi:GNAT superfamily N-acetyltransferase